MTNNVIEREPFEISLRYGERHLFNELDAQRTNMLRTVDPTDGSVEFRSYRKPVSGESPDVLQRVSVWGQNPYM